MNIIVGLVFLVLALLGVVLRKTYFALPLAELKRRAEKHEPHSAAIYRVVAYGNSLRSLLWLYIGLTSAVSLILLARVLPVWASILIIGPVLWIVFSLVPASRVGRLGKLLAKWATPLISRLLNWLHPVLSRGADAIEKRYTTAKHTGLFEREDLLELIDRQQWQTDSRLSREELEIAKRALSFDEYQVNDVLTPRKQIKTIQADDVIGPVLIDELHKEHQEYVLVRDGKKGPVIGTLEFQALGIDSKGHVRDHMDSTVYYLHENDTLSEALHAFFVTNHPLFVVINSFEEYVGIITIENVLRQLLGHVPGDDFDQYANLAAVATRHTKPISSKEVDAEIDLSQEPDETKESDESTDSK